MKLAVRGFHAGADVEALPTAVWTRRFDERVHHVVDEHVVTGVGTVAEYLGGLARQQRLREDCHHAGLAVRILAWPIDIGRCDVRALQTVEMPKRVEVN